MLLLLAGAEGPAAVASWEEGEVVQCCVAVALLRLLLIERENGGGSTGSCNGQACGCHGREAGGCW